MGRLLTAMGVPMLLTVLRGPVLSRSALSRPRVRQEVERITGTVLPAFGLLVAADPR